MSGWEEATLSEVCTFENGDRGSNYPSKKVLVSSGIPFVNAGNLNNGRIDQSSLLCVTPERFDLLSRGKFSDGDVLFCLRGSLGKFALVEGFDQGAIASSLVIVRPMSDLATAFFLYYLESEFCKKAIAEFGGGAAQPNLSAKDLGRFRIPLPPLAEQKRIVAILDEAFGAIAKAKENAERNLANAKELFESYLNKVFTEKGEGWEETTVANIALPEKGAMRTGPFGSQLLKREFVSEGIAVLGIDNAVKNEFRWGKKRFITKEKYEELKRFTVKPGDVLITIMGTCGRCAVVPDDIPTAINTKHLCCISLDQQKCIPEFLHAYFLHHPLSRDYLTRKAKGAIMSGLNMGIIKELPVQLPNLKKQSEIVKVFHELQNNQIDLNQVYEDKLTDLDELKQSILQKAFTGQLTSKSSELQSI